MIRAASPLTISLFLLRISVALVMTMWAADKIINPGHSAVVFSNFYNIEISSDFLKAIGVLQLALLLAFTVGAFKTVSYGLVLLLHTGSTLSSWQQYLAPFDNLLFLAAWPMLAACVSLFLLRKDDVLLSVSQRSTE